MNNVYYLLNDWCKRGKQRNFRIERDRVYIMEDDKIVCAVAAKKTPGIDHKSRVWVGDNASIEDCAEAAIKRFAENYENKQSTLRTDSA